MHDTTSSKDFYSMRQFTALPKGLVLSVKGAATGADSRDGSDLHRGRVALQTDRRQHKAETLIHDLHRGRREQQEFIWSDGEANGIAGRCFEFNESDSVLKPDDASADLRHPVIGNFFSSRIIQRQRRCNRRRDCLTRFVEDGGHGVKTPTPSKQRRDFFETKKNIDARRRNIVLSRNGNRQEKINLRVACRFRTRNRSFFQEVA